MKILVVGSGAREHALLWKLAQSPRRPKLFVAPGNAGMSKLAKLVPIEAHDKERLAGFAETKKIDLTICGPEAPLVAGLADTFAQMSLPFVGPTRLASLLEGSKCYAKAVMGHLGIPTADWKVFRDFDDARDYLKNVDHPVVIKADGLAGGKGVVLPKDTEEAIATARAMLVDDAYGEAGRSIVIEERLSGTEVSFLCFTDGRTAIPMATAMDYKRLGDGDTGPNTGGMGNVSPNPQLDEDARMHVMDRVVNPLIAGLRRHNIVYRGVLFVGLMMTAKGPKVLEFNVRFGDPETQVIVPRLQTDLIEVLEAVAEERLSDLTLRWSHRPAVCVVLASRGYPGNAAPGSAIDGLDSIEGQDVMVFHAGTKKVGGKYVTAGGRVLSVVAQGETLAEARRRVYDSLSHIRFDGMQLRKDIGEGL
jgi:phosphoribosylamine--glycine ligase